MPDGLEASIDSRCVAGNTAAVVDSDAVMPVVVKCNWLMGVV